MRFDEPRGIHLSVLCDKTAPAHTLCINLPLVDPAQAWS